MDPLQIRPLRADDVERLGLFFNAIACDPATTGYFHPHPFTREFAAELCGRVERILDRYFVAVDGGEIVGYSMLRGWDEGYQVPSFGVCVHPGSRSTGLGRRLLTHAIEQCRDSGAEKLRLTVFKGNTRAVALYERFGFRMTDKNADELIGILDIAPLQRKAS